MICVSPIFLEALKSTNADPFELDDPQTFAAQPVCIQLIGRPFQDEEITAVAEVVDAAING